MREIVYIQTGQCGNQIGSSFWQTIAEEHGIEEDGQYNGTSHLQLAGTNVYFNETSRNRYVPRSVLVDTEPASMDNVLAAPYGNLFRRDNFAFGFRGSSFTSIWPEHYYTGANFSDGILDVVRREAEGCDLLQGFQFTHSLGGGTGSGLGCLVLSRIMDEFPDRIKATYSIVPSPISDSIVEPYHTLLSFNQLIDNSDETFCIDNAALMDICTETLEIHTPCFDDFNHLIASAMSGITAGFRFPGQLNSDMRKLAVNMIPSPRLHFFTVGLTPLTNRKDISFPSLTAQDPSQRIFGPKNMMADSDFRNGRYLTCSAIFRGQVSMKEVEDQMKAAQDRNSSFFIDWFPHNAQTSFCSISPPGLETSATFVANSTSIQDILKRVVDRFAAVFRRKAFLHLFTHEGMDEEEFIEARSNVQNLVDEYKRCEEVDID